MTHRVLLTGVGGFVGSQLARQLLAEDHEVTALISPSTNRWRISDIENKLSLIDSDLTNVKAIAGRIREARSDICIHLAWHGWAGQASADENLSSLSVSLELLRIMPAIGCRRFVAAGTCYEYDLGGERLAETTALRPHNVYGLCKKSMFEVSQVFGKLAGLSVLNPRLFYSYGPFEDTRRVVPAIALCLLRGEVAKVTPGLQIRDYLHVEDVARAIWAATQSPVTGAVNIASGEPVTIAEIARTIGRLLGKSHLVSIGADRYREDDPMRVLADATLLRREIGWAPRYNLEDGLAHTLAWLEARAGQVK
jgi:nucleoside-diphosphate-sugar epimerase